VRDLISIRPLVGDTAGEVLVGLRVVHAAVEALADLSSKMFPTVPREEPGVVASLGVPRVSGGSKVGSGRLWL
jgi:hypothetical protein